MLYIFECAVLVLVWTRFGALSALSQKGCPAIRMIKTFCVYYFNLIFSIIRQFQFNYLKNKIDLMVPCWCLQAAAAATSEPRGSGAVVPRAGGASARRAGCDRVAAALVPRPHQSAGGGGPPRLTGPGFLPGAAVRARLGLRHQLPGRRPLQALPRRHQRPRRRLPVPRRQPDLPQVTRWVGVAWSMAEYGYTPRLLWPSLFVSQPANAVSLCCRGAGEVPPRAPHHAVGRGAPHGAVQTPRVATPAAPSRAPAAPPTASAAAATAPRHSPPEASLRQK